MQIEAWDVLMKSKFSCSQLEMQWAAESDSHVGVFCDAIEEYEHKKGQSINFILPLNMIRCNNSF